ncbi:hypothetical protein BS50DRAFT_625397 [Corynespora cassiicola Philippines]|uniref:Zn(2)-C6 fungal-type domain-containing protein n=1 Tax=Corynespora cassiicola Philippines TaxID=1448308 RepID=A0A2T2N940_CORCC|nr:hypothetical protein BS50DRAFT_625397 [Corynespora cassiicola Philippines]
MSELASGSSTSRSRSFNGCATVGIRHRCRNRHTKCDEIRPSCMVCENAGIICGGYEKNIFFDFEDFPEPGSLRFRRPLLTEEERKSMSNWLTRTVPLSLVSQSLLQLDEESEELHNSKDRQITRGPFGVFRLAKQPVAQATSALTIPSLHVDSQATLEEFEEDIFPVDSSFSLGTQGLFQNIFDHQIDQVSSQSLERPCNIMGDESIQEFFNGSLVMDMSLPCSENNPISFTSFSDLTIPHPEQSPESDIETLRVGIPHSVPKDAIFLLKHYQSTVLRLLTPFKHSKTPWHILFVPHAKNCLAGLTLGENIEYAGLCTFFGMLAISAFSIGGISKSAIWLEKGEKYKQQARSHIKAMLQTSYCVPKVAKYKSILMALLTMTQLSMVTHNIDQTECYLLEAEKFIRLRGLKRKKSRKVRLLHHCYVFERILHESTLVNGRNMSHRDHVRKAVESSELVIYGQDCVGFRLGKWNNLPIDMMRIKSQDEGENDLHLQNPGIWAATLYPEIFGVPEKWVFCLSLVVRLAREKDDMEKTRNGNFLSAKEFLGRAKAIEQCISQMRQPSSTLDDPVSNIQENMLDAMQDALSIFFYRKIYDVESALLQQKVLHVRDCLLRCNVSDPEETYGTIRLFWPALMAAAEAEDSEVQESFAAWFRDAERRNGLGLFRDSLNFLSSCWQEKCTPRCGADMWVAPTFERVHVVSQ